MEPPENSLVAPTGIGRVRHQRTLMALVGAAAGAVWLLAVNSLSLSGNTGSLVVLCGFAIAPLPVFVWSRRRERVFETSLAGLRDQVQQLEQTIEVMRYRTGRLREDLFAADQQARLSHQLTILGQFTAGFLHEFNNPLAILTNRIEILLDERKDDRALCGDLEQMLKEAQYMGRVARTLLPALRRQRSDETFSPCIPAEALRDVCSSLQSSAEERNVRLVLEEAKTPPAELPAHVLTEIARTLVLNAIEALGGRDAATIWLRVEEYRTPGARIMIRVEDNGPGVPDTIREHLFEPFVSKGPGRERLGLGLFLVASLIRTYDGSVRYEPRPEGGAGFVLELPPARFTKVQPYHWFVKGAL